MKQISLFFTIVLSSLLGFGQSVSIGDILSTNRSTIRSSDLPDNILEVNCNDNTPIPFHDGQLMYQTPNDVNVYSTPLCGDIDGDGIVDIVVAHYTATDNYYRRHWSSQLDIYSGNNLSLQSTISIPAEVYLQYLPYGIARYPKGDGSIQGAIFAICCDGKIRSYSKNGVLLNTSDFNVPCDGTPSFADFNQDGFLEVYIGNAIFDAATLKRLCIGPTNGNMGLSHRGTPSSEAYPHRSNYAIPYAYNVLDDDKLELICGNTIYNVIIISRTDPSLNSVTVNKTITPPNGNPQDGQVAIADFDLDGEVEILVTKDLTDDSTEDYAYLYAYRPSNGSILFEYSLLCRSVGFPAICNIDNNPNPEILFIDYQYDTYAEKMYCLRYTPTSGLSTIWEAHHNDPSGMTTMAFFDFNLDEIPEIVFRDANNLNIINGQNGEILYSYPMFSGTAGEHPIIADVNNDGHAEIIVPGLLEYYSGVNGHGNLLMFGNPAWPNARKVWNQYAYNVTNINNDLTIPLHHFDNATVFTATDHTIRRPYNNFLYQATYITPTGEPVGTEGVPQYVDLYETFNGSFQWNGTSYTQPGDYIQYFTDINGCDSIVTLHLSAGITGFPDNILEGDCNTPIQGFEWGIREDWSSNSNIYCRIMPLVGDLDDDGIPEIVCFDVQGNSSSQTAAKTINVYDGRSKALKAQISVENLVWAHGNGPYGLVKLPNRKGLIVTACKDTRLYAYDITAANPNNPVWASNESYNTGYNDFSVSIGFADFNGDGHPEVYVRNKIFDAETGILLATAQGGNNQANSYSHNSHTNHNKLSCPIAFDICGDTRQELILGNEIYDVIITNRFGTSGNHATLTKSITPPNGIINDGHVQVADFNLDGHPDILISNRDAEESYGTVSFYVWDVYNNLTSQPIQLDTHFTGKSVPLIADFDNDGFVEILIDCCHEGDKGFRGYRFNPAINGFNFLWSLPIDEDSYSNTATLFDFNADGKNELVYTDNRYLRVYDVSTMLPTELSKIDCGEISIMQVPIVADVDNDGSAEIVVTGKAGGYMQANTMLKVYKSSTEPWRLTRKVWNQYMYHVTNVNEDLTIPTICFNTANVFTDSNGSIRRPYNNFLCQASYITATGEPYNPSGYVEAEHYGEGCETYIYHGTTYTESGDYEYLIENPLGCDTLLTVHVHLGDTIHHSLYKSVCQPYIWNGITYEDSGIYHQTFTSVQGCDSIVTLYLNVGEQIMTNLVVNTCDSYTWNGITYTETDLYEQTFTSAQGCDSIVVLDLTIKGSANVSPIHGESLIYYQTNGNFTYSIDPVPDCFGYEWSIDGPWSISASPDSPECTVNINSPGTATLKVRVYTECGYAERTLLINHDFRPDIVIYPNPTKADFNLKLLGMEGTAYIVIYDYLGQLIDRFSVETTVDGTTVLYSLAGKAAGVYLVSVTNNYYKVAKKVIKETPSSYGFYNWEW